MLPMQTNMHQAAHPGFGSRVGAHQHLLFGEVPENRGKRRAKESGNTMIYVPRVIMATWLAWWAYGIFSPNRLVQEQHIGDN